MLSSGEENAFKSIFQKISGYSKIKVTEENLYLVQWIKNIVILKLFHWK